MPVARISTARDVTMLYGTDGAPLAEFCDDRVTACRLDPADGTAEASSSGGNGNSNSSTPVSRTPQRCSTG